MRRVFLILCLAHGFVPRATWAQGQPLGPEFRVNAYTTFRQGRPSVATDAAGNFVVVWESLFQSEDQLGVKGQRYDSTGTPLGPEFRVNTYQPGDQGNPSVAVDLSGNFVIVWQSYYQDGSGFGIFGQRYDSSGAPLGVEFRVNTSGGNWETSPSVAADSAGNFVVVWQSYPLPSPLAREVLGQRYSGTGTQLGPEFRVNTYTTGFQGDPSVVADAAGDFVVVWTSIDGSFNADIFGQRFGSSGTPQGSEFRVNTHTTSQQLFPSVASDAAGNFVVVWPSQYQDGSDQGVFGQRYAASGTPLGAEFRINTFTTGQQYLPSVAADSSGDFVVAWQSDAQDGSGYGVFGQRYASSGAALGPEFQVNAFTTGYQSATTVAADTDGNFVVLWGSEGQDGDAGGVFGQRYGQILPVSLLRLTVE